MGRSLAVLVAYPSDNRLEHNQNLSLCGVLLQPLTSELHRFAINPFFKDICFPKAGNAKARASQWVSKSLNTICRTSFKRPGCFRLALANCTADKLCAVQLLVVKPIISKWNVSQSSRPEIVSISRLSLWLCFCIEPEQSIKTWWHIDEMHNVWMVKDAILICGDVMSLVIVVALTMPSSKWSDVLGSLCGVATKLVSIAAKQRVLICRHDVVGEFCLSSVIGYAWRVCLRDDLIRCWIKETW